MSEKQKLLDDAFIAGWIARDHLFKPAHERHDVDRDKALDEFNNKRDFKDTMKGTHT